MNKFEINIYLFQSKFLVLENLQKKSYNEKNCVSVKPKFAIFH